MTKHTPWAAFNGTTKLPSSPWLMARSKPVYYYNSAL